MFNSSNLNVPEAETALHVSFLMLPEYTLSAFSNAIGILRMANRLTDRALIPGLYIALMASQSFLVQVLS